MSQKQQIINQVESLMDTADLASSSTEQPETTCVLQSRYDGTKEIVVEVETVRRVRKRLRTRSKPCPLCEEMSEFITLGEASKLFEIEIERLSGFIEANKCHFERSADESIFVCVPSLLEKMGCQK